MIAIKTARKFIEQNPGSDAAPTLARLVLALESEIDFDLGALYLLPLASFELAIDILKEWRIDRYYAGKAKLFAVSAQLSVSPRSNA